MQAIKISVTGNTAAVTCLTPVTAGTVGMPVEFTFDESWAGLTKTAVFRVGERTMDCLGLELQTVVPWELLRRPGCHLFAGVYGCNQDGSLQIPTVWADLGVILPGADPTGDVSADPSLPVWKQALEGVERSANRVTSIDKNADDDHYPTAKAVYDCVKESQRADEEYCDVLNIEEVVFSPEPGMRMKIGDTIFVLIDRATPTIDQVVNKMMQWVYDESYLITEEYILEGTNCYMAGMAFVVLGDSASITIEGQFISFPAPGIYVADEINQIAIPGCNIFAMTHSVPDLVYLYPTTDGYLDHSGYGSTADAPYSSKELRKLINSKCKVLIGTGSNVVAEPMICYVKNKEFHIVVMWYRSHDEFYQLDLKGYGLLDY